MALLGTRVQVPRVTIFRQTERKTPDRPCTNCGDATPGNFCRNCGQRKVEVRVSLRRMLMEVLDDQFSINSALPRTVGALLFRPGHLTREYMNGRIARFIPPFRLYLVASVAFFLVLSMLPALRDPLADATSTDGPVVVHPQPPSPKDALRRGPGGAVVAPPVPPRPGEGMDFLEGVELTTGNMELDSILKVRLDHFRQMEPRDAARQLIRGYLDHVPQMMFIMLPLFAALLKVLYFRSKRFYVEHFVFALHLHAFSFLTYLAMIAVRWPPVVGVLWLWMFVYLYASMKRVYREGWVTTAIKYGILGFTYCVAVVIGGMLTFVATVLTA